MHIEPGLVDGTKIFLSYATAAAALAYTGKVAFDTALKDGLAALALRSAIAVALVFCFFEVLPHHPVGVSEVHLILGTTLLLVFGTAALARRIVPQDVAYVDLSYRQAFKLSAAYQGGIVVWVGFWALYGRGTGLENLGQIASFGAAYMTVVLVEPLVDLGVLAAAKGWRRLQGTALVERRLYGAA
jgi:hypothetical protein